MPTPARPAWGILDYQQSALELLALQAGERPPKDCHPLTEQRLASRGDWTHLDLVRDIVAATWGEQAQGLDDRRLMAQGMGTAALADLYSANANRRVLTRAPRLLDKVSAFCAPVENRNYLPAETGFFALDVGVADASTSIREWQTISARAASEAVQLVSSPIRLRFTEQLIVDDNIGAVNAVIDAVNLASHQNELAAAFGVLTSDPTLKDGDTLFSSDNTAATLPLAVQALREQTLNGQAADADPYTLLVPSVDEDTARQALAARYVGGEPWVKLVSTAYLPASAWYLCADPTLFPCIVRGTMRGSDGASLKFSPGTANEREGSRDVVLEAQHTYQYAAVSRVGIIKINLS